MWDPAEGRRLSWPRLLGNDTEAGGVVYDGCVDQLGTRHVLLPAVHGQRRSCSAADDAAAARVVIYAVGHQAV